MLVPPFHNALRFDLDEEFNKCIMFNMSTYLTPRQFGAVVGLSKQRIIQLIHLGKVKAERIDKYFAIREKEINKFRPSEDLPEALPSF